MNLLNGVPDAWAFTAVLGKLHVPLIGGHKSLLLIEGVGFGSWSVLWPAVQPFVAAHPQCSIGNWSYISWWTNLLEGSVGCSPLTHGRVRATSVLSIGSLLGEPLAQALFSFVDSASGANSHVCTPSQLGGMVASSQLRSDNSAGSYLRQASLDTACIVGYSDAQEDQTVAAIVTNFSAALGSEGLRSGVYVGEPLVEFNGKPGWEELYWSPEQISRLKRVKRAVDPGNVFQCQQCVST